MLLKLTLGVSRLTSKGATIPGMVEKVLDIPNNSPAYLKKVFLNVDLELFGTVHNHVTA